MVNLHEKNVAEPMGIEPTTSWSPVGRTSEPPTLGMNGIASICVFVCVEVLRPSQPNGVMLSVVSLLNHMFTGQA